MKTLIRTALFSVSNKDGLADFAQALTALIPDLKIIASGGTARTLSAAECEVVDTTAFTESPECFGGRVKTLHPKIAGGILYRRGRDDAEAKSLGIEPIDLVVCNLYNFAAVAQEEASLEALVEEIDIGGMTLIRSAAKNYASVIVVVDPADYRPLLKAIEAEDEDELAKIRQALAAKAFEMTADYESLVSSVMSRQLTGELIKRPKLVGGRQLRYGENPDQDGWVYQLENERGIAQAEVLSGKALSFNNFEDATAAYRAASSLIAIGANTGVAVIKHGNLCGYATAPEIKTAFELAWQGDSKSAFGSVIALTAPATMDLKDCLKGRFIEVLIAPDYSEDLLNWLASSKPNLRVLRVSYDKGESLQYKSVSGGLLLQTSKSNQVPQQKVVTKRTPELEQARLIPFGVAAVKHAKSNAIALVRSVGPKSFQLIGTGAGQPNRIDSLQRLAIPKAVENLLSEHEQDKEYDPKSDLSKCVLASDGFFPFADSIRYAAEQGITCCVQPGGSIRDDEVVTAANEAEMSMIFTGERYFTH